MSIKLVSNYTNCHKSLSLSAMAQVGLEVHADLAMIVTDPISQA